MAHTYHHLGQALPSDRCFQTAARLLKLAISLVCFAFRQSTKRLGAIFFRRSNIPLTVLTYHAVSAQQLNRFERQMSELSRWSVPVFADEDLNGTAHRRVAVTFDDGFQSVIDHALPILRAKEIPATLFVATGYLGGKPGWIPESAQDPNDWIASAEVLGALDSRLCRLGSHTVNHPHLDQVPPVRAKEELQTSKGKLEEIAGRPVTMLSLPYGSSSAAVLAAARECGYARVFLNIPARCDPAHPFVAGRVSVSPNDWKLEFRLKILGAYGWLAYVIPVKRAMADLLRRFW